MKKMRLIIILTLIWVGINSCEKDGLKGDATIVAFPQHHGKNIFGATVYVKFKTKDLPANPTTNYDLKIVGDANEEHVHIRGLLWGDYYLYAVGYDSTIHLPVVGGIAVPITWDKRQTEIDINVPVSE